MTEWRRQFIAWAGQERARSGPWYDASLPATTPDEPADEARRRAVDAGLGWFRDGRYQWSGPELTALFTPPATLAAASRATTDRLAFLLQCKMAHAQGTELDALLANISDGPAEAQLHHAAMLRLETRALVPPSPQSASKLAAEALAVLERRMPTAVQERCIEVVSVLARAPGVAVDVFSECVARALRSERQAAALKVEPNDIDDVIFGLLKGVAANQPNRLKADAVQMTAQRYAFIAGVLAGRHPTWWDDAWQALRGESVSLANAYLRGGSHSLHGTLPAGVVAAVADPVASVSVNGWGIVAGIDSPGAGRLLATIAREPLVEARARVARSLGLPAGATALHPLLSDPDARVRSAAAFTLLAHNGLSADDLGRLRADANSPSTFLRHAATRALALAGAAVFDDGPTLVDAVLDEPDGIRRVGQSAARALAVWAGEESRWRELYKRAAVDRRWLVALAAALDAGFVGLFPAPADQVEALRVYALLWVGEPSTSLAAATVLAAHPDPQERIFDLFSRSGLPPSELLALATVAPSAQRAHPTLVEPLWRWIEDESTETGPRAAAMTALGFVAPWSPSLLTRLVPHLDGEIADETYASLARIAAKSN